MAINVTLQRNNGTGFEEMRVRTDVTLVDNLSTVLVDNLNDLDDVNASPTDGQALVWDNTNSLWVAGDVAVDTSDKLSIDGTIAMTGNLDMGSNVIIMGSNLTDNIDHIWYSDAAYDSKPGQYHFVADLPVDKGVITPSIGNAAVRAGSFYNTAGTEVSYVGHDHSGTYLEALPDHAHGDLKNTGQVHAEATIAAGDKILIADNDATCALRRGASLTFTANTTKFLREDGSFQTPAYISNTWRGIVNDLTTGGTTVSLSAAQGVALKGLIDGITEYGGEVAAHETTYDHANIGHSHPYLADDHDASGVTAALITAWNAAKTHADSAHAPSNAITGITETMVLCALGFAPMAVHTHPYLADTTTTITTAQATAITNNTAKTSYEGEVATHETTYNHGNFLTSLPSHTHGNITNDGKIGTISNRVIVTTTGGALTTEAQGTAFNRGFGYEANTVVEGMHLCATNPHGITEYNGEVATHETTYDHANIGHGHPYLADTTTTISVAQANAIVANSAKTSYEGEVATHETTYNHANFLTSLPSHAHGALSNTGHFAAGMGVEAGMQLVVARPTTGLICKTSITFSASTTTKFLNEVGAWTVPPDNNTQNTIINDLTTGGAANSLSAQQGVVLKGLVDGKIAAGDNIGTGATEYMAGDTTIPTIHANTVIGTTYPGYYAPAGGSILVYHGTYNWSTLQAGSNGNVLQLSSGMPAWGAVPSHSHSYDNYNGWDLYVDTVSKGRITTGENVNFIGGTNVTLSYSTTNNAITINAAGGSGMTKTDIETEDYFSNFFVCKLHAGTTGATIGDSTSDYFGKGWICQIIRQYETSWSDLAFKKDVEVVDLSQAATHFFNNIDVKAYNYTNEDSSGLKKLGMIAQDIQGVLGDYPTLRDQLVMTDEESGKLLLSTSNLATLKTVMIKELLRKQIKLEELLIAKGVVTYEELIQ